MKKPYQYNIIRLDDHDIAIPVKEAYYTVRVVAKDRDNKILEIFEQPWRNDIPFQEAATKIMEYATRCNTESWDLLEKCYTTLLANEDHLPSELDDLLKELDDQFDRENYVPQ